ncbi:hypothetical protein D9M70_567080 [compost metagenome]
MNTGFPVTRGARDEVLGAAQHGQRRAERLGERRTRRNVGTGQAMPGERAATAEAKRLGRRRVAAKHAERLRVVDHEAPSHVGRQAR